MRAPIVGMPPFDRNGDGLQTILIRCAIDPCPLGPVHAAARHFPVYPTLEEARSAAYGPERILVGRRYVLNDGRLCQSLQCPFDLRLAQSCQMDQKLREADHLCWHFPHAVQEHTFEYRALCRRQVAASLPQSFRILLPFLVRELLLKPIDQGDRARQHGIPSDTTG